MIFKQLFDKTSSTYTYLISSGKNREALIIDPVLENTDKYLDILNNCLKYIKVPSILIGGCSGYDDIKKLFSVYKSVAAGASSIFVYKGKLKAVLISYPSEEERNEIVNNL